MAKCPFFGLCGGCKYDFDADDYRAKKVNDLPRGIDGANAVWGTPGTRRRADFVALNNHFGFYRATSRDIVDVNHCPNMVPEIDAILPDLAALPWGGLASVLVTLCDNGIVVNVTSNVPYCSVAFRDGVQKLPENVIRWTWNGVIVRDIAAPVVSFGDMTVPFPDSGFLQPTIQTESALRDMVVAAVANSKHVADLFCGLGCFTFATGADGFDIVGAVGSKRDLFKRPLGSQRLTEFDAIIMDPPRAGAIDQCKLLAASNVPRVVYISCNPATWMADRWILERGGYKMTKCVPVDQFVGAAHWEIFSIFDKETPEPVAE
ncbi:MAG: class I SAM-dependent RNA methyltransferase [Alphaproteobacteria bacterium]|nr:class I SAM-dependent RNA methyltransferase [Alphaproteobacteria bacterium]